MIPKADRTKEAISARFIRTVCANLSANKRVRRTLPLKGRIHIDRQLPFLSVYRHPPDRADGGTDRLVVGEASYLIASGERYLRKSLGELVGEVVETLSSEFGAFLIVEIWSTSEQNADPSTDPLHPRPGFRIVTNKTRRPTQIVETLSANLSSIRILKRNAEVEVDRGKKIAPPGLPPLLPAATARKLGCQTIGIEVRPIYRDPASEEDYPLVRRRLHRSLSRALQQTFFEFARSQTTHRPPHYHALGRRAMVKAVWEVDRKLAAISNEFDFLLQVTPVNAASAWTQFRHRRFERAPIFYYRPRSFDPSLLRRKLWDISIERLEDPTLGELFRDKRIELDTQLSMLTHLETPRFFYGSMQLFGGVDDQLMRTAEDLLIQIPARSREHSRGGYLNAAAFAERAKEEIAHYRQSYPELSARVEFRNDITGLMVSRGHLLVSQSSKIPASRVEALLQHEVGTHLVTYYNGLSQPFCQLYSGLAGYEELQEGLAVFAEYLVGGLSRPRLRLLAARVLAVRRRIEGASFVDTFREIDRTYGFEQRTAFTLTMRIFRGGGLTKDLVYLRGLVSLLKYLKKGGELEPLFVGKIGTDHIPLVEELQLRRVLHPAPLLPRYLDMPQSRERLKIARNGLSIINLIERKK